MEGLCKPWFIQNGVESRAIDHQALARCRDQKFEKLENWTFWIYNNYKNDRLKIIGRSYETSGQAAEAEGL